MSPVHIVQQHTNLSEAISITKYNKVTSTKDWSYTKTVQWSKAGTYTGCLRVHTHTRTRTHTHTHTHARTHIWLYLLMYQIRTTHVKVPTHSSTPFQSQFQIQQIKTKECSEVSFCVSSQQEGWFMLHFKHQCVLFLGKAKQWFDEAIEHLAKDRMETLVQSQ